MVKRDPLEIKVAESLPEDLRQYEIDFLKAFQEPSKEQRTKKLQDTMADLNRQCWYENEGLQQ